MMICQQNTYLFLHTSQIMANVFFSMRVYMLKETKQNVSCINSFFLNFCLEKLLFQQAMELNGHEFESSRAQVSCHYTDPQGLNRPVFTMVCHPDWQDHKNACEFQGVVIKGLGTLITKTDR